MAVVKFCKAELPSCSLREQPLAMAIPFLADGALR